MANPRPQGLKKHRRKHRASRRRLVQRVGTLPVVRLNREKQWRDVYHRLLTFSWPQFFLVMSLWYVGINVAFGLLYWLDAAGVAEARPDRFEDHFFFSVQTMATIGYGVMHPQTLYANLIMTLETLIGMIFFAVLTGGRRGDASAGL